MPGPTPISLAVIADELGPIENYALRPYDRGETAGRVVLTMEPNAQDKQET
jgi:hypothetical protein